MKIYGANHLVGSGMHAKAISDYNRVIFNGCFFVMSISCWYIIKKEGIFQANKARRFIYLEFQINITKSVDYGIKVPGELSFLVNWDFVTPVNSLDQFKPEDRQPVVIIFQSYYLMIMMGLYMFFMNSLALILLKKDNLFKPQWMMKIFASLF